jgi:Uma2 family endonuclease
MNVALEQLESPVRMVPSEPMSVASFWEFCAENPDVLCELEPNGDLIVMTPTLGGSGFHTSYINRMLGNWAEDDGRGFVVDSNTGCQLPDGSIRMPDAAWIAATRWTPPSIHDDAPPPCPDFVIELRSKTDRLPPLRKKMEAWMANGCELAWLIDPRRKVVEIYRSGKAMEEQEGHSAVYGEGPVAGFVLELGRIWDDAATFPG